MDLTAGRSRGVRWLDGLLDASITVFAAWTVAYQVALALRLDRIVAVLLFAVFVVLLVVLRSRLSGPDDLDTEGVRPVSIAAGGLVLAGVVAALAAVAGRSLIFWGLASLTVVAAVVWASRRAVTPPAGGSFLARIEVFGVLGLAGAMSALSLIVRSPAGDNTYYLNRALYVSQHPGAFPVRDTVFSNQLFPSVAPADTIASLEALIGTMAAHLPIDVRTLFLLVFPAVVVALGVLAFWRLARSSRAIAPLVATGGAVLFLVLQSGQSGWGSVIVRRPFWGKAMLIVLAVPWLWHHATAFARTGSRRSLALTAAGAVAAIGFSSSGTFIGTLVIVSALVPLVVFPPEGRSRADGVRRALIGSTAVAYPLIAGAVGSYAMRDLGISYPFRNHDALSVWKEVAGTGPELAIVTIITLIGWLAIRTQRARLGVAFSVLAVLALFSPVGLDVATKLGAGSIGARFLWAIPVPVIAGLIVDAPLALRDRSWRVVGVLGVTAVLAVSMAGGGRLILANRGDSAFSRPQWDFSPAALASARELIRLADGEGIVAAPDKVSQVVPNMSLSVFAASPRIGYTQNLAPVAGRGFRGPARLLLLEAMEGRGQVDAAKVATALRALHVEAACSLHRARSMVEPAFEAAGFELQGADDLCLYWLRT